jgi:uncharacterized tellurite resistance protein B-like protein
MSLFHSKDENAGPLTFSEKESAVALLFLVVTADGSIQPEEEELVIAASNRMKLLKDQAIPEFNSIVFKVRDAIEASGREAVFAAAAKGLPADLGDTIYALAADIVCADGEICDAEIAYVRQLQEALKVNDETATKILEVMKIKNRG